MQTWHEILGHCNYEDVQKLQGVVKGMEIKGSAVRPNQLCVYTRQIHPDEKQELDTKAKKPLELVHTDLAGPMPTTSIEGHKYARLLQMLMYFLKSKCDAVQAAERVLADIAPYGEVRCIRSDNGTEFTG